MCIECAIECKCIKSMQILILVSDFIGTVLIRGFYNVLVDDGEVNHRDVTWVRFYKILKC